MGFLVLRESLVACCSTLSLGKTRAGAAAPPAAVEVFVG
jgi:hypothetical protein